MFIVEIQVVMRSVSSQDPLVPDCDGAVPKFANDTVKQHIRVPRKKRSEVGHHVECERERFLVVVLSIEREVVDFVHLK